MPAAADPTFDPVRIGIVSVSDRASSGVYEDKGLPALKVWLGRALRNPITFDARLIPDEQATDQRHPDRTWSMPAVHWC